MTVSVALILACILGGLVAVVGIGVHARRHGLRRAGRWLLLPVGTIQTFAFVPASVALAERVWSAGDPRFWAAIAVGSTGVLCHVLGWRAALRTPRRASQCPACEYPINGLSRCPECGRPCASSDA